MVQLNAPSKPGAASTALGLLTALVALVLGVGLLLRTESAFGAVWASLFLVCGVVVLVAAWIPRVSAGRAPPAREERWDGEPARFLPRSSGPTGRAGMLVLVLLGGWFVAMGVVGVLEENWVWPVLAVVPAVYFLAFPVLAALGRLRSGGLWLTAERVVDEHHGVRGELSLADVETVVPRSGSVHVVPVAGRPVQQRSLAPRPWRARLRTDELVISTQGLATDPETLAADLRQRASVVRP